MSTSTTIIPNAARERVEATFEDGSKRTAFYELDGERVGFRCWDDDGSLTMEYAMRGGVMHGPFRAFWKDGQVSQESTYVDGKEHGRTKQYDANGALLGSYMMEHGTGIDLWFERMGVLAEERHYLDGQRHGYERWWCGDNVTVWQEEHFWHGEAHGIFRQWNSKGRLRRDFPRYYVGGTQVTKRQYERARLTNPNLPPVIPEDNQPARVLPPSLRPSSRARDVPPQKKI